eukprot:CAMPEP_0170605886 /NCGR_PEP_ID=MMETSP0224-20130122/20210_1 /TAXON_ID=285029 /ORGANISM="Togula jolla, Strain CCCM 725" /LENGTH=315 /DNA_ID=CAMNT_0010930915 /DNA_START=40 /DNA_END=987 /DNA_ORIENTATION=+
MAPKQVQRWEAAAVTVAAMGVLRSSLAFVAPTHMKDVSGSRGIHNSAARNVRGVATGAGPAVLGLAAAAAGSSTALSGAGLAAFAGLGVAVVGSQKGRQQRRAASALRATRTEWYRKVKRVGGDQALFDVDIQKPLGLRLQPFPQKEGVGVSLVVEGGNADILNRAVCVDDQPGMWVLEGDALMAINGQDCSDSSIEEIAEMVSASGSDVVKLTLMRNTRKGPVKVVILPDGKMSTVKRGAKLSVAAEWTKEKELKYGCTDGWCGTCWHRERTTNGIFKPCCDVLTGDWDNVMPLVLTAKPEKAGDATYTNPRGA